MRTFVTAVRLLGHDSEKHNFRYDWINSFQTGRNDPETHYRVHETNKGPPPPLKGHARVEGVGDFTSVCV